MPIPLWKTLLSYSFLFGALFSLFMLHEHVETAAAARIAWEPGANEVIAADTEHFGSAFEVMEEEAEEILPLPLTPDQKEETPTIVPIARATPLIVVDAGHGGRDGGAVANGLLEKNLTLELAHRLVRMLRDKGYEVRETRSSDATIGLESRIRMVNDWDPDVLVSLHMNTVVNRPDVQGVETYYCRSKSLPAARRLQRKMHWHGSVGIRDLRGQHLAERVQAEICRASGAQNRGIRERTYLVLHGTICPAILVECGFMTSREEASRLRNASYQQKLCNGITLGIESFLQRSPALELTVEAPVEGPPAPVRF